MLAGSGHVKHVADKNIPAVVAAHGDKGSESLDSSTDMVPIDAPLQRTREPTLAG